MKDYKYHYVYRITNIITQMYYYGDRSCNCHPSEDIGKKYFSTSSLKLFINDQKINPQDYKYKIIKIFETNREDAKQLEVDLHKKFDVKNHPKFINRANQTCKGFSTSGRELSTSHKNKISEFFKGRLDSDETKLKKSLAMKGRILTSEHKSNISKARKNVEPWNKGLELPEQSGKKNSFYGQTHSNTTKSVISKKSLEQWDNYTDLEKEEIFKKRGLTAVKNGSQKGMNNPSAKIYKVISPKGAETICRGNLRTFCKTNNLGVDSMYAIAKGKGPKSIKSKYFGWVVEEISD